MAPGVKSGKLQITVLLAELSVGITPPASNADMTAHAGVNRHRLLGDSQQLVSYVETDLRKYEVIIFLVSYNNESNYEL